MTYDDGIAVWGPLAVQVKVLNTYDSEVVLTVFLYCLSFPWSLATSSCILPWFLLSSSHWKVS